MRTRKCLRIEVLHELQYSASEKASDFIHQEVPIERMFGDVCWATWGRRGETRDTIGIFLHGVIFHARASAQSVVFRNVIEFNMVSCRSG